MKKVTLLLIVLVFVAGIAWVSVQYLNKTEALTGEAVASLNASSQRLYWINRISLIGPDSAYREFKEIYADSPLAGHTAAHLFGSILYQETGEKGFLICDDALGYGCLHQVVADFLTDKGPGSIVGLEDDCEAKFGTDQRFCVHGIGHGIEEYYRGNLPLALEQCLHLEEESNQYYCAAGVYMEDFVPFGLREDAVTIQPISIGRYAPCDDVTPSKFRNVCFYSLPHWWFALHQSPEQVVMYCNELPTALRLQCASGMGVDLPGVVGYERTLIDNACRNLKSPAEQIICLNSSEESLRSLGLE